MATIATALSPTRAASAPYSRSIVDDVELSADRSVTKKVSAVFQRRSKVESDWAMMKYHKSELKTLEPARTQSVTLPTFNPTPTMTGPTSPRSIMQSGFDGSTPRADTSVPSACAPTMVGTILDDPDYIDLVFEALIGPEALQKPSNFKDQYHGRLQAQQLVVLSAVNKTWQKAAAYYLKLSEQRLNTMIISSPVGLFRQSELALAWKSGRAGPAPFVIGHGGPVRKSLAKRHARHAEANTKAACKAVPRCKPSAAQLHPTKLELPLPFPVTKPLSSTGVSLITQTPPDSDFFRLLGVQKSSPLEPLLIFSAYSAPRFHFAAATSVPVSAS